MNKKTLILLLIGVVLCLNLKAQNNAVNYLNSQLRAYFSPLTKPNPSKPFLYDMAAHVTDSVFFSTTCIDTLETEMWYKVYDEMFHSAYDTTLFQPLDAVWTNGNKFNPDTVPMGIMNFAFYKLKNDAMTTGNYFNFDTVNDILTDKVPRNSEPYIDSLMFAAAPMVPTAHFLNPVFRVDPQLIYFDAFTSGMFDPSKCQLRIDFGDGLGEIVFDPTVVTNYQVNYHDNGEHIINTAIYDDRGVLLEKSTSNLYIIAPTANVPADQYLDFDGIRAGLFSGCNATGISGKTVIYLEGFDVLDFIPSQNRTVSDIYSGMISDDKIVQLKNDGYSFLVVDWKNSRIDMRYNALYLLNLIEYLKCNISDEEQFVIMGESMGGVIARYTLTYMETKLYTQHDVTPFFQDNNDPNNLLYLEIHGHELYLLPHHWGDVVRQHNTRLLITLDSPHQGANIPMSIQYAYRTAMGVFGSYISNTLKIITTAFNLFIDGQAAQQMMIYHIDTKSALSPPTYTACADKDRFFAQLYNMGNYPRFAKVVELSNGSLYGARQTNYYTSSARVANDTLLDFGATLYARVLWHRINIFGGNMLAQTNPNGTGHIFDAGIGWYKIRLRLKRFGIRISQTYCSILGVYENANIKPLCTSAGGFAGDPLFVSNVPSSNGYSLSNNSWYLNLFHYNHTITGTGCVKFDSHLGLNGFASANFDYHYCSDGLHFCFIPVASALDYGAVLTRIPLDIPNDGINTITNTMLASVIIGYPDEGAYANRGHLGSIHEPFRNPPIYNLTQTPSIPPFGPYIYYTCQNSNEVVERGLINLEVGDEELYLENVTLPWSAEYQTEFDIHVNDPNPYYWYVNTPQPFYPTGCYSKNNPYSIAQPNGYATFIVDNVNSPSATPGLSDGGLNPAYYTEIDQPMTVCCLNFIGKNLLVNPANNLSPNRDKFVRIYPNPNNNIIADIDYKFSTQGSFVKIEVINTLGSSVYSKMLTGANSLDKITVPMNLTQMKLTPGVYLVRLSNGLEVLTTKLLIN